MKKLKFKLAGKEMLSKEQLKKVTGGDYGNPNCGDDCSSQQTYLCCVWWGWPITIGNTDCCTASYWCANYGGYMVTNDAGRCSWES